jgi:hypothetical protein
VVGPSYFTVEKPLKMVSLMNTSKQKDKAL